ncbi:unnamed protein product [Cladocopium goreaui]|uniref:Uncharacterized protein n=1 Tax=Cladocopium goreaui TaxID=2562237 RepID=A0A9P1GGX9_9DINO|nr:unnamed protein product [Cladocopium goreaui]
MLHRWLVWQFIFERLRCMPGLLAFHMEYDCLRFQKLDSCMISVHADRTLQDLAGLCTCESYARSFKVGGRHLAPPSLRRPGSRGRLRPWLFAASPGIDAKVKVNDQMSFSTTL